MQKNYRRTLLACYLGLITQAIAANFAPLLFLKFHTDYAIPLGQIALISTAYFLTQLIVDVLCARFVDRIGYRTCIVASEVTSALGLAGLGAGSRAGGNRLAAAAAFWAAAGVALLLNWLLEDVLEFRLAPWLWVVVFSVVLSVVLGWILSKLFFEPIVRLSRAMRRVGDGDFSIQLETSSRIREVRDTYDNFNLMTQALASTEIIQTDFVSNVSHEFKTPINAIEGYSTLLQGSDNLDGDQREYVEKILLNTGRLSSLVGSILLLSKLENQQIPTNQTKYRLDEQIRQSVVALEAAWTQKSIELDVELDRACYVGNEPMMRHAWDNLISNAVKFSPNGGTVKLRLSQDPGRLVFTVEDQGPGLSEEAQKHIFDKFYQADTSHKQEGNGLGLALVKRILTIEKGQITAFNIPEGGCRITVTLHAD
jgi:signal transduction histidine kinase